MSTETETQRAVVRLVLEREREPATLERLFGSDALAAVDALEADGIIARHGELLSASSAVRWLDDIGLIVDG